MDRRGFLKFLGQVPAAALLPAVAYAHGGVVDRLAGSYTGIVGEIGISPLTGPPVAVRVVDERSRGGPIETTESISHDGKRTIRMIVRDEAAAMARTAWLRS